MLQHPSSPIEIAHSEPLVLSSTSPDPASPTMKASTILPVLTYVVPAPAATDAENKAKCTQRFPIIAEAIGYFCNKTDDAAMQHYTDDIIVPSPYADQGFKYTRFDMSTGWLHVTGTCNPPQWLPRQWCNAQFWDLCANTNDPRGWNTRQFGPGGCQSFLIEGRSDADIIIK